LGRRHEYLYREKSRGDACVARWCNPGEACLAPTQMYYTSDTDLRLLGRWGCRRRSGRGKRGVVSLDDLVGHIDVLIDVSVKLRRPNDDGCQVLFLGISLNQRLHLLADLLDINVLPALDFFGSILLESS